MIKRIYCQALLTEKVAQFIEKQNPQPKKRCETCKKLDKNSRCDCYNRPMKPDYNRCFNHSDYNPNSFNFKAPDNIEQIALENEVDYYG
jgi:hypothetical protein